MHDRAHKLPEVVLPLFTMRLDAVSVPEVHPQVRYLMHIRNEKHVGIEFMIEGDTRMGYVSTRCEITHFRLARARDFQLEGCLAPELKAVLQRLARDVRLKGIV